MQEPSNPVTERCTHLIQLKVSKTDWERMKLRAKTHGFSTLSAFLKFCALNPSLEEKVNKILTYQMALASRLKLEEVQK